MLDRKEQIKHRVASQRERARRVEMQLLEPAHIAELRDLVRQCSPGPWTECQANDGACSCRLVWSHDGAHTIACVTPDPEQESVRLRPETLAANTRLVALARQLVPAMLDEIEDLRRQLAAKADA